MKSCIGACELVLKELDEWKAVAFPPHSNYMDMKTSLAGVQWCFVPSSITFDDDDDGLKQRLLDYTAVARALHTFTSPLHLWSQLDTWRFGMDGGAAAPPCTQTGTQTPKVLVFSDTTIRKLWEWLMFAGGREVLKARTCHHYQIMMDIVLSSDRAFELATQERDQNGLVLSLGFPWNAAFEQQQHSSVFVMKSVLHYALNSTEKIWRTLTDRNQPYLIRLLQDEARFVAAGPPFVTQNPLVGVFVVSVAMADAAGVLDDRGALLAMNLPTERINEVLIPSVDVFTVNEHRAESGIQRAAAQVGLDKRRRYLLRKATPLMLALLCRDICDDQLYTCDDHLCATAGFRPKTIQALLRRRDLNIRVCGQVSDTKYPNRPERSMTAFGIFSGAYTGTNMRQFAYAVGCDSDGQMHRVHDHIVDVFGLVSTHPTYLMKAEPYIRDVLQNGQGNCESHIKCKCVTESRLLLPVLVTLVLDYAAVPTILPPGYVPPAKKLKPKHNPKSASASSASTASPASASASATFASPASASAAFASPPFYSASSDSEEPTETPVKKSSLKSGSKRKFINVDAEVIDLSHDDEDDEKEEEDERERGARLRQKLTH